jgi:hypothetical protein
MVKIVSQTPQMENIFKSIEATLGTIESVDCISGLTITKYRNTSDALTQILTSNDMMMKFLVVKFCGFVRADVLLSILH